MVALDVSPTRISHETLITALTAGFEVNNRLIYAIQPTAERFNQVYGVAQHQSIGAALVAGLLLGLDEQQLHHAVGLAATLTPLPSLHQYNWQQRPLLSIKDAVAPAAQAAVQAVMMVQQGMSGSLDVLDGEQGFWRMIGSDQFARDILTHSLGSHWYADYGSFKIYPARRWLACALESMDTLVKETGWQVEDIRSIAVYTFPRIVDDMMDYRPQTVTDAQFSLPGPWQPSQPDSHLVQTGTLNKICKIRRCWAWQIKSPPVSMRIFRSHDRPGSPAWRARGVNACQW
jgi:2-methylcitrate dehydratase PrpD